MTDGRAISFRTEGRGRQPAFYLRGHDTPWRHFDSVQLVGRHSLREYQALFKYTEPRWADALVEAGSIRLGTLANFRRIEAHSAARGDPKEGVAVSLTNGEPALWDSESAPSFLKETLRVPPGVRLQLEKGAVFRVEQRWLNCFLYCTSDRLGDDLLQDFGGACVVIENPVRFFSLISARLYQPDRNGVAQAVRVSIGRCEYLEREETWPHTTAYHPAFRKPPRYSYQSEVRAVWESTSDEIEPLDLILPELGRYCRRIR